MMTKTVDCVECGVSAPYGRLSCPSCGALLASVTGGRKSAVRVAQVESQPEAAPASKPVAAATSSAVATAVREPAKTNGTRKRAAPPPFLDAATSATATTTPASDVPPATPTPAPAAAATPPPAATAAPTPPPAATPARTPTYAPTPAARARNGASTPTPTPAPVAPAPTPEPAAAPLPAPTPAATEPPPIPAAVGTAGRTPSYAPTPAAALRARTTTPATSARTPAAKAEAERAAIVPLLEPSAIASLPATPWAPIEEPAPVLSARPYQRHLAYELDPVEAAPPPSAYRPPSQATVMAMATAAANDAARATPPADDSEAAGAKAKTVKDATWWLESIPDPERFVEIAGWFVVVGSTMALLGFLLPWSRVVIGASTIGGYFDGWGLASPTHLLVFVGLLAVLALAIRRAPVPPWISSGIFGLVFGGLLIGLAWPYLIGPLGADVGLTMTTLGGVSLMIGGVVALWATRHVAAEPLV